MPAPTDAAPLTLYTPESANRALPYVRRLVEDLVRDHAEWRAALAELAGVSAGDTALRRRAAYLADDIRCALANVAALGVECKGMDVGLVDFPAVVDGAPAYLCWQLGEPAVAWWHAADTGFAGRQPIPGAVPPAGAAAAGSCA